MIMKETQDVVACVVDFGMFMPVAMSLSDQLKKVYYYTPTEKGFQEFSEFVFGDGFDEIIRCDDFLDPAIVDEVDLFVFPYILHSGTQLLLERMGKAVWGARRADELERLKGKFYRTLEMIDLPVVPHIEVLGLSSLRQHLKKHDDLYIKISKYRGTMDTWHHVDYAQSAGYLDTLAVKLGPFQNDMLFYVIDPIKTDIEGGVDTYCIDGQWPSHSVVGYEKKNESYLATVKPTSDIAEEFLRVNEAIAPVLERYSYRQFFSTEVRVANGKSYFIDPTCRTASPAGEEMLDLFGNIGDIMWRGANGIMVHPEVTHAFAGESYLHKKPKSGEWRCLEVPQDLPAKVKLYGCAQQDGKFWWPPDDEEVIGCVVGLGDSPEEVIESIKQTAEALEEQQVEIKIAGFSDLLHEIEEADKAGIPFSDEAMPDPTIVLAP